MGILLLIATKICGAHNIKVIYSSGQTETSPRYPTVKCQNHKLHLCQKPNKGCLCPHPHTPKSNFDDSAVNPIQPASLIHQDHPACFSMKLSLR